MNGTIFKSLARKFIEILSSVGIGITSKSELLRLQNQREFFNTNMVRNLIAGSKGVLHVGAHTGQEAEEYFKLGMNVVWIEADPLSYQRLKQNIAKYPAQSAIHALVASVQGETVEFYISSNDGLSSSLFRVGPESGFPQLSMNKQIPMTTSRLDNLISCEEAKNLTHWVLDVQGAELLVLEGAGTLIDHCFSIQVEVSTREVYLGGATYSEIKCFLTKKGFTPLFDAAPNSHENVIFVRARMN